MIKVKNMSKSRIWIGDRVIKPNEVAEIAKEELEYSGVKALIKSGELKIIKEKEEKKKQEKKK